MHTLLQSIKAVITKGAVKFAFVEQSITYYNSSILKKSLILTSSQAFKNIYKYISMLQVNK